MLKPDEIEEVTIQNLESPWKEALLSQEIGLFDVPEDIVRKAMLEGIRRYHKQKEYASLTESTCF